MYRYTLDLPVVGDTEVGVPVEKFTADILSEASSQFPGYVPKIVAALNPHIAQVKRYAIHDLQQFLDEYAVPEIEAQKANISAEIERLEGQASKWLVLYGLAIVAGVGATTWYLSRR